MATQLSDSFRRMALSLVKRFGKEGYIIRRETQAPSDPETPTKPGVITTSDFLCKAAVTSFTVEQIDGIQVLRDDLQVVGAWTEGIPEDIKPGDLFVDGVINYKIIPPHQPITVNGELVAYILQVRR